ncbi:MAG TPA: LemA family protein [Burkholderiales bacterium]|nr:LemA family protein [Burkholderiales bacterium]
MKTAIIVAIVLAASVAIALTGYAYRTLRIESDQVNAAWSLLAERYRQRAQVAQQSLKILRTYAPYELEVIRSLQSALGWLNRNPPTMELLVEPKRFAAFEATQAELSKALTRLRDVVDSEEKLNSHLVMARLMRDLEDIDRKMRLNRAAYLKAVREYNETVGRLPLLARVWRFEARPELVIQEEAVPKKLPLSE